MILLAVSLGIALHSSPVAKDHWLALPGPRHALVISAPWTDDLTPGGPFEGAYERDLEDLKGALMTCGFSADEIRSCFRPSTADEGREFLRQLANIAAKWKSGSLALLISGHGAPIESKDGFAAAWQLEHPNRKDIFIPYSEILDLLARVPKGVDILFVPDTCHTNMLRGTIPKNVTAVLWDEDPKETRCRAQCIREGTRANGLLSRAFAEALPASTGRLDLKRRLNERISALKKFAKGPVWNVTIEGRN